MFIKQLVIYGFRSYGDQVIVEPFDRHINVVVGRNGSGKSNFFAAIRFVLGDAFNQTSKDERQALLFEGSSSITMNAYVELVLDNSDHRIPGASSSDQVVIRRTVGPKKDEYSLDGKTITKKEMSNLLEAAGFSKVNPFYIVPQGRVTSLTNAKDSERLAILREIAGTSVYETKKEESNKLLKQSQLKMRDVNENLQILEEKLVNLQAEVADFENFQDLDRQKRSLDYTLLNREMQELDSRLNVLEEAREGDLKLTEHALDEFAKLDEERVVIEKSIVDLKNKNESLSMERTTLSQDLDETLQKHMETLTKLQDIETTMSSHQSLNESREKGAQLMESRIEDVEKRISEIQPEFESLLSEESALQARVDKLEALQHGIQLKLGHAREFHNKAERDTWVKQQIQGLNKQLHDANDILADLEKDLDGIDSQHKDVSAELKQKRDDLERILVECRTLNKEFLAAESAKDKALDERKQLWREESKVDMAVDSAKEALQDAEKKISKTMNRDLCLGFVAVPRLAPTEGYYGPLCDLISTEPHFKLALESVAGNSLFHQVVETDTVASVIIERLSKENAGRATFIPLNRIKQQEYHYPDDPNVIPLINKIEVDEQFLPAVKQVFGNVLLCKDLETCHRYAVSKQMVTITLQGDKIDPRGVLVGGFHDSRNSRLDAAKELKESRHLLSQLDEQKRELQIKQKEVDQTVTVSLNNTQKLARQKQQQEDLLEKLNGEVLRRLSQQERQLNELLSGKHAAVEEARKTVETLVHQKEIYQSDLKKPFSRDLDPEDAQQMQSITEKLPKLLESLDTIKGNRIFLENQKKLLESELHEILYTQRDNLLTSTEQISESTYSESLRDGLSDHAKQLEGKVNSLRTQLSRVSTDLEKSIKKLDKSKAKLESIENDLSRSATLFQKQQKKVEKSTAKRNLLTDRKSELELKIRQLGFLPEEAFVRFQGLESEEIITKLTEVSDELRKYQHVNRKAVEQYQTFSEQKRSLTERRDNLNMSFESIRSLIQTLDDRKQAAIQRTFKQVAKSFEETFKHLVPGGSAQLVMQKKSQPLSPDNSVNSEGEEQDESQLHVEYESETSQLAGQDQDKDQDDQDEYDDFIGASIVVSFSNGIQQRIEQLSGGQKSLCALALILAIQQCDPAPFYLFDEIDANLDTQYRASVANMINHITNSTGAQFICTTFRPELLNVANKFYGVFFQNRRSSVTVIDKEDALSFVQTSA